MQGILEQQGLENQIVSSMKYTQFSEKGPRMNNEDSLNIVEIADKRTLFVVCDGMGGHSCGEVASQTVCDAFSEYWQQHSEEADSLSELWPPNRATAYAAVLGGNMNMHILRLAKTAI